MKPIQIKIPRNNAIVGVVRLDREAEEVIRRLQGQSGLPASRIASQIIAQAADMVEIVRDEA